jgi:hypothetical protein
MADRNAKRRMIEGRSLEAYAFVGQRRHEGDQCATLLRVQTPRRGNRALRGHGRKQPETRASEEAHEDSPSVHAEDTSRDAHGWRGEAMLRRRHIGGPMNTVTIGSTIQEW